MHQIDLHMKYVIISLFFTLLPFKLSAQQEQGVFEHPRFARVDKKHVVQAKDHSNDDTEKVYSYESASEQPSIYPDSVSPLLAKVNLWHQYDLPYTKNTPIVEDKHCPTGCVALAMSQVMHYYRYPLKGIGNNQYIDSLGCKKTIYSDFSSHTYDWNNMLYEYDHTNYTDVQANAVALLQYDCGVSVNMRYDKDASGAYSVRQPMALIKNFGYDKGAQIYYRDFYSYNEIHSMLKKELSSGRPILISGSNKNRSHAFIIDGYNEKDEFHIMLGNPDGFGDNWTKLVNMTADSDGYGIGTPENGMNIIQCFILGVQPRTEDSEKNEHHLFVMKDLKALTTSSGRNESLKVASNDLCNVGCNFHNDSVVLMLTKDNKNIMPLYTYKRIFLLEEIEDTTYNDTIDITIPNGITSGKYNIVPMYKDNGKWTEVRCCVGTPNYLIADVRSDEITLSSDSSEMAYITIEDLSVPDYMFNAAAPDFSVRIKGHNAELCGRLYIELEPMFENGKSFYLERHGINIAKDEEQEFHYCRGKIWTPQAGKYKLHIYYDNSVFADELIELQLPNEYTVEYISGSVFQIASK